jgi:hypothetical protein
MNLIGKWQLIGWKDLSSEKSFPSKEVTLYFNEIDLFKLKTGFLKTSAKTVKKSISSIQIFRWNFEKKSKKLKIQYVSRSHSEILNIREIDESCMDVYTNNSVLRFKRQCK